MTAPIPLDLRDLDDAKVAEAMPHMGECKYAAPCIIGTLIPVEMRAGLDGYDPPNIATLIQKGRFDFPDDAQRKLAFNLQAAFDSEIPSQFNTILAQIRALPA